MLSEVGKQLRDIQTTLTLPVELPGRGHQLRRAVASRCRGRSLPGVGDQFWLVVKCVDMRRSSLHAEEDHMFRASGEMRRFRCQRSCGGLRVATQSVLLRQCGKSQVTESIGASLQKLAPGERCRVHDVGGVEM